MPLLVPCTGTVQGVHSARANIGLREIGVAGQEKERKFRFVHDHHNLDLKDSHLLASTSNYKSHYNQSFQRSASSLQIRCSSRRSVHLPHAITPRQQLEAYQSNSRAIKGLI